MSARTVAGTIETKTNRRESGMARIDVPIHDAELNSEWDNINVHKLHLDKYGEVDESKTDYEWEIRVNDDGTLHVWPPKSKRGGKSLPDQFCFDPFDKDLYKWLLKKGKLGH